VGLLKKIRDLFQSSTSDRAYWVYVKCNQCGEYLASRIDLYNQLSIRYGDDGDTTFYCRKVIIGSKGCYRPIEVEFTFDKNKQIIDRKIKGGEFITEGEYHSSRSESSESSE
jgi:hypothetical protein